MDEDRMQNMNVKMMTLVITMSISEICDDATSVG